MAGSRSSQRARFGLTAVVAALCALAFATAARAAGPFEINDLREQAYGPLVGGTDYTAGFETENDVDWYLFYVKTYSQMDISASNLSSCGEAHIELMDRDGKAITYFHAGNLNQIEHLLITLSAGRYYFYVYNHGCTGAGYRFRIDPAAAISPSRTCGEAIVTRETVTPALAPLTAKIAKNGEALAKAQSRTASLRATLAKLKRKRNVSRYRKSYARRKLAEAKAAQAKVEVARIGLQTLGAQYNEALTAANGQIAASC
jgi:hypothetical protein